MARINTNVSSLIARNNLGRTNENLSVRLQRLSTGLRINRGADDPAGLIVSERLRSEMKGIDQAIDNSERASSVIATTEGYLAEVADLLNSIKSLVVQAANTGGVSDEEIEANQLEIDSAIGSITRISNTASFAGLQLLNGNLDYTTAVWTRRTSPAFRSMVPSSEPMRASMSASKSSIQQRPHHSSSRETRLASIRGPFRKM